MINMFFVTVATVCLIIMVTSVWGQCPLQCSCSVSYGSNCINSSLTEIPQSGFNQQLTRLNISFNSIAVLNEGSLKRISKLIHLNLSYNKIEIINPEAFLTLKNLESLDLSNNNITSIHSDTFMFNMQLKWLSLAGNNFFRFTDKNSLYLPELWYWKLSHCGLKDIPLDTFNDIQKLRELYLDNNEIVTLNTVVFHRLSQLQKLDICYNDLQTVDDTVFRPLSNLISLSVCHNNVSRINIKFLTVAARIRDVNLEGNPWICDCESAQVLYTCVEKERCYLNLTCEFPEDLRGRNWDVINQLGCETTESPTTVEIAPVFVDVTTVSMTHQTTTGQPEEVGFTKKEYWFWATIVLSVIVLVCVLIVVSLAIRCRRQRNKSTGEAPVTDDDVSTNSGGFNSRYILNEDSNQIGLHLIRVRYRGLAEESVD